MKGSPVGKEEPALSLLADGVALDAGHTRDLPIHEAGWRAHQGGGVQDQYIQSVLFLYSCKGQFKSETKKIIPLKIAQK